MQEFIMKDKDGVFYELKEYNVKVELSLQDGNKTLKVFLTNEK